MTAQEPDLIRLKPRGRREELFTNPLDDWLFERGIGPRIVGDGFVCTANWRRYVATFLIHRGHLWIEQVDSTGTALVAAMQRDRWRPREDGQGMVQELEPEDLWRKRAETIDAEQRPFDLEGIFPKSDETLVRDQKGRVRADWFSGELRIPEGAELEYVHGGYASTYERDRLILIEKGATVRDWTRENGWPVVSV